MPKKQNEKFRANLSYEEMKNALPKIERRIKELQEFDVNSVRKQFSPEVRSLETKEGKIKTGRHYCDPKISHEELGSEDLEGAYKNAKTKITIS